MVKNPQETFKKLIFLNIVRLKDEIDPKKLDNAIETTSFKSLQDIEKQGNLEKTFIL